MKVLHTGFDSLDVAFKGKITFEFERELSSAKEWAGEYRSPIPIEFNGVRMLVESTGAKGGYTYMCDTGDFGGTWFFKKPNRNDPWGVRFSSNSPPLAVHGLAWVRNDIESTLNKLGIIVQPNGVSLGRVDFAVDMLAPDFILNPAHFVMHARCNRKSRDEITDFEVNGQSNRTTSVTIGKNPGRQAIVYDKRKQMIEQRKVHWPEIWNANLKAMGECALDFSDPKTSVIWRSELRAYKRHLKDVWNIVGWNDFYNKIGDVFLAMASDIRHTAPDTDSNRSRWKNSIIWETLLARLSEDLFEFSCGASPQKIKEVFFDEHLRLLRTQRAGLSVSLAGLQGVAAKDFKNFLVSEANEDFLLTKRHKDKIEDRIFRAGSRYIFKKRS